MPPALKDSPARPLRVTNPISSPDSVAQRKRSALVSQTAEASEQEAILYTLQNNLSRFARSNNRKLILQTFHGSKLLENVPLGQVPVSKISPEALAETEAVLDSNRALVVNDHTVSSSRSLTLTSLIKALMDQLCEGLPDYDSSESYQTLLSRLEAIPGQTFDAVKALIGSPHIFLKPITEETKRPPPSVTPIIDIYQADAGVVHCRIVQVVHVGLFRKSDLTVNKPWMWLTCTVHERFNFTTEASVRHVVVEAPQF